MNFIFIKIYKIVSIIFMITVICNNSYIRSELCIDFSYQLRYSMLRDHSVASGNDWSVPHTAGNRDVNPRSVTGLKLLILELFRKY